MTITNLPEDVFGNAPHDEIVIYEYTAYAKAFRGRSVMSKNAVSLVIEGHKTMHFAEKTVQGNDEEIHFLSAGNCIATIDISRLPFSSILIFFDDKVLTDFFIKYERLTKRIGQKDLPSEAFVSIRKDESIDYFIASLQALLRSQANMSGEMKQLKLEELLLHLLEKYPGKILPFILTRKNARPELAIRKVVENNIMNNLSVDELAFLCNVSPSTFKRKFMKIYQTSPITWFLEQRMKTAANLLRFNHEKPGEIFHKIGYENHSSFAKAFKKYHGVSPNDYRAQKMIA